MSEFPLVAIIMFGSAGEWDVYKRNNKLFNELGKFDAGSRPTWECSCHLFIFLVILTWKCFKFVVARECNRSFRV
jgi:hypothetical protein